MIRKLQLIKKARVQNKVYAYIHYPSALSKYEWAVIHISPKTSGSKGRFWVQIYQI